MTLQQSLIQIFGATLNDYVPELETERHIQGDLSVFTTRDGSISLHSNTFGEGFHSSYGAWREAQEKFLRPAEIQRFSESKNINVLDICFGMGYNSGCLIENIINQGTSLEWWGIEIDQRPIEIGIENSKFTSIWSNEVQRILLSVSKYGRWESKRSKGQMLWGDARNMINLLPQKLLFDLILLDAFSPSKCPMLWSEEFLSRLAQKLAFNGRLITYSSAAAIRASLRRAGLKLGSQISLSDKKWSNGTIAINTTQEINSCNKESIWQSLSKMEEEHLLTRAAIPYRDPSGCGTIREILDRRGKEQNNCKLERTYQWKQRWRDVIRINH